MSVVVTIVLDKRRLKKKTNSYPVKLRVTYERESRYYQTKWDLSAELFAKMTASRLSLEHLKIRGALKELESTAEKIAGALDPFSFSEFEKDFVLHNGSFQQRKFIKASLLPATYEFDIERYLHRFPIFKNSPPTPGTILATFLSYIDKLLREHRISTAASYQTSYSAFARFRGNVRFTDITITYLKEFEIWMLEQKYSKTTVGIYIRCLRAIFNEAAFDGIIKKEKCYPFGRRKYKRHQSKRHLFFEIPKYG